MGCAGKVKFGVCSSLLVREELSKADMRDLEGDEKELKGTGWAGGGGQLEHRSCGKEPVGPPWELEGRGRLERSEGGRGWRMAS